jgi:hypothetical protein
MNDEWVVEIGIPGPTGPQGLPGSGAIQFATLAVMMATTGYRGATAYALDDVNDNIYKWSVIQNTWRVAF